MLCCLLSNNKKRAQFRSKEPNASPYASDESKFEHDKPARLMNALTRLQMAHRTRCRCVSKLTISLHTPPLLWTMTRAKAKQTLKRDRAAFFLDFFGGFKHLLLGCDGRNRGPVVRPDTHTPVYTWKRCTHSTFPYAHLAMHPAPGQNRGAATRSPFRPRPGGYSAPVASTFCPSHWVRAVSRSAEVPFRLRRSDCVESAVSAGPASGAHPFIYLEIYAVAQLS
jgi:hypothetical protein